MKGPLDIYSHVVKIDLFKDFNDEREAFFAMFLDTKNKIIAIKLISVGSLNGSIVHPREILKPAIEYSSASVALLHNHPSGDPSPSNEDTIFSVRFQKACEIMGIGFVDHVIVGHNAYRSMKEIGSI